MFAALALPSTRKIILSRPHSSPMAMYGDFIAHRHRYLFLCYKSHESWSPRVEDSDSVPLPKMLTSAIEARKNHIKYNTHLNICDGGGDDLNLSDGDVLLFPELMVFRGLTGSNVDSFVEDVLVNEFPWVNEIQDELSGSYIFVCADNKRNQGCVCSRFLIEKFKEEIESQNLKSYIAVMACSHGGEHAGNVVIFSEGTAAKFGLGNWYGNVTPNDVVELIDRQIGHREVVDRIWRGDVQPDITEAENASEQKAESVGGCCQGANGFCFCRWRKWFYPRDLLILSSIFFAYCVYSYRRRR